MPSGIYPITCPFHWPKKTQPIPSKPILPPIADCTLGDNQMGKIHNILIVDDSKSMRFAIHATLVNAGYNVQAANNGVEALDLAKKGTFDLVLTDINMPKMDGYQLIESLRQLKAFKFTPILTLTTQSDAFSKQKAKNIGATGWIVKPFSPSNLIEVLAKFIKPKAAVA